MNYHKGPANVTGFKSRCLVLWVKFIQPGADLGGDSTAVALQAKRSSRDGFHKTELMLTINFRDFKPAESSRIFTGGFAPFE